MATESSFPQNPIPGLVISLAYQPCSSPPVITASVTNTNLFPVTLASYSSPLDDLVLQLGIPHITPAGASEPIAYPAIQIKRMWPPLNGSIEGFAPGECKTKDITLSQPPIPLGELKGKNVTVDLEGRWMGVLKKAKEDVSEEDWDGDALFSGDYVSPSVKMTIE